MTRLVNVGDYQDNKRNVLCWDQEETTRIIYEISKKFLEHDPEIKIGSNYYLSKNPNGINLESIKTELHRLAYFTKEYREEEEPHISHTITVNLVALKIFDAGSNKDSYMAIKLNLGTSRDTRLEKRITPKSVEKLDEIVKLFAEELNKQLEARKESFTKTIKEYKINLEHSKIFPDFAEKLGFGRKEALEDDMFGGNYSFITKDFGETNIKLSQRFDGDFDIHISKIDEKTLRELMEIGF